MSRPQLTRKEVCYLLQISRWTLWRWERRGCPVVGNRIAEDALLAWMRCNILHHKGGGVLQLEPQNCAD